MPLRPYKNGPTECNRVLLKYINLLLLLFCFKALRHDGKKRQHQLSIKEFFIPIICQYFHHSPIIGTYPRADGANCPRKHFSPAIRESPRKTNTTLFRKGLNPTLYTSTTLYLVDTQSYIIYTSQGTIGHKVQCAGGDEWVTCDRASLRAVASRRRVSVNFLLDFRRLQEMLDLR